MNDDKTRYTHLNAADPEGARIAREVYDLAEAALKREAPELVAMMNESRGFFVNLYDRDYDGVLPVVINYAPDGVMLQILEFAHPDVGPVRALVFRLHPDITPGRMMERHTDLSLPPGFGETRQ